jgi:hypothetical protein
VADEDGLEPLPLQPASSTASSRSPLFSMVFSADGFMIFSLLPTESYQLKVALPVVLAKVTVTVQLPLMTPVV